MNNLPLTLRNTVAALIIFTALKSNAQEGIISIQQDNKIDKLLKERKHLLTIGELKTHFSIQVISGELETARKTLKECKNKFSELKSNIVYEEPNYKVRVGEFRNRLDADRALLEISEEFKGAFVLRPKNK
jgi:dihydroorotase